MELPDAFSQSGAEVVPEAWWTVFEDARLDALVDTALASNFDLMVAWERVRAAQAVVDFEAAELYPFVNAEASAILSEAESEGQGGAEVRLGLGAAYEVDLWGRIGARVAAERFSARATRADYEAAALSLSAEVTRAFYRLVEAQSQLRLAEEQIETNREVLQLIESRFGAGLVGGVDVLRQRQLLQATYEQRAEAAGRVQLLAQQIAVLVGRPPTRDVGPVPAALPELPPPPATGVPIDLVRRRPDVQSALLQVQAADRRVAAAISSRYPRLTLTASGSVAPVAADDVFREWAYSFAGSLLAPIFYGGRLRAEVDRTEAVRQQRLFAYAQTVLVAFREVEAALTMEATRREEIEHLERQVELGQRAFEQLRVQYLNGSGSYLEVLTAVDDLQQLRRDLLSARLDLVESRIGLYRALAGPFEPPPETS
jgi:NodT family efflux transporter outer membrane factor (OMF) lipoprotein